MSGKHRVVGLFFISKLKIEGFIQVVFKKNDGQVQLPGRDEAR